MWLSVTLASQVLSKPPKCIYAQFFNSLSYNIETGLVSEELNTNYTFSIVLG